MNLEYTAPENALYNRLFTMALGKEGRSNVAPKKGTLHPASAIHKILNVPTKPAGMQSQVNLPLSALISCCNICSIKLNDW